MSVILIPAPIHGGYQFKPFCSILAEILSFVKLNLRDQLMLISSSSVFPVLAGNGICYLRWMQGDCLLEGCILFWDVPESIGM